MGAEPECLCDQCLLAEGKGTSRHGDTKGCRLSTPCLCRQCDNYGQRGICPLATETPCGHLDKIAFLVRAAGWVPEDISMSDEELGFVADYALDGPEINGRADFVKYLRRYWKRRQMDEAGA